MKLKPLAVGTALALALFVSTAGTASAQNYYRGGNGGYRVNGYNYYGPRFANNFHQPFGPRYFASPIYSPVFSQGFYGNSFGFNNGFGGFNNGFGGFNNGFGGFNNGFGGFPGNGFGGSGFGFSIGGFR